MRVENDIIGCFSKPNVTVIGRAPLSLEEIESEIRPTGGWYPIPCPCVLCCRVTVCAIQKISPYVRRLELMASTVQEL